MDKWQLLSNNAQEKLELAVLALEQKHFNSAVENGFFAIELIFKAAILKEFPKSDEDLWGHSLSKLIRYRNRYLQKKLCKGKTVYKLLNELMSDANAWSPADRYYGKGSKELAELYLKSSKRIVKWIEKNCLQN